MLFNTYHLRTDDKISSDLGTKSSHLYIHHKNKYMCKSISIDNMSWFRKPENNKICVRLKKLAQTLKKSNVLPGK
jgi:hypothetical protein